MTVPSPATAKSGIWRSSIGPGANPGGTRPDTEEVRSQLLWQPVDKIPPAFERRCIRAGRLASTIHDVKTTLHYVNHSIQSAAPRLRSALLLGSVKVPPGREAFQLRGVATPTGVAMTVIHGLLSPGGPRQPLRQLSLLREGYRRGAGRILPIMNHKEDSPCGRESKPATPGTPRRRGHRAACGSSGRHRGGHRSIPAEGDPSMRCD